MNDYTAIPWPRDADFRLSAHFQRRELECPCCYQLTLDPILLLALEELRRLAGGARIHVTSGYRCTPHNTAVGGVPNSQHLVGRAADIAVLTLTLSQLADCAHACYWFRRGGIGPCRRRTALHVDVRDTGPERWTEP